MEMHLATIWESIADVIGNEVAITNGTNSRTWAEYDDRASRVARSLTSAGLSPNSKVALFLYNGNEYMEAHYGVLKMRGVVVNINYRYLDDELWYLLDNSDAEAVIFHSSLADRVKRVATRLPDLKLLMVVDDGPTPDGENIEIDQALGFESAISNADPMERIERDEDDIYMMFTGGTTGMPKGVMYDIGGLTQGMLEGGFPLVGLEPPTNAAEVASSVKAAVDAGVRMVSLSCAPLMHGTGCWIGWFIPHLTGAHVVTLASRSLDPHEALETIDRHSVTAVTIVGDSFAKPIVAAIDERRHDGSDYDLSSIAMFLSSGVMWTSEVKQQMIDRMEHVMLVDAIGSSEGTMGSQITGKGMPIETATFTQSPATKVFTTDDREVVPGSDEVGMVAAGGNIPLGYYKDEKKSARTFRVVDGVRYSFPGDLAQVAADGTLILLGRGSQVINTGGEKVFPEEVEESVKRVAGVFDCLVVGIDDEKFGQAVTAVASLNPGASVSESEIVAAVKIDLAGYKAPKSVVFVDAIPRSPNGKADYRQAKILASE